MHDMLNIHSFSDIMPTGIPYPKTKCTLPNWCVCVWIISIDIYLIKLSTTGTQLIIFRNHIPPFIFKLFKQI